LEVFLNEPTEFDFKKSYVKSLHKKKRISLTNFRYKNLGEGLNVCRIDQIFNLERDALEGWRGRKKNNK